MSYRSEDWHVAGAFFYSEFRDLQVPVQPLGALPNIDSLVENGGRANRHGVELQAQWFPAVDWTVDAVGVYTNTEIEELEVDGQDRSGESFPNAPEFTASLGISYQPDQGVFGHVRGTWASEAFTQISEPELTSLDERFDVSARLGYRGEAWELYVFATNLLDRDYAVSALDGRAIGNGIVSKLNEPRTIGVGFTREW